MVRGGHAPILLHKSPLSYSCERHSTDLSSFVLSKVKIPVTSFLAVMEKSQAVQARTSTDSNHVKKTLVGLAVEKDAEGHAQHLEVQATAVDIPDYSPAETKKILRKVDSRLVPMLAFFYCMSKFVPIVYLSS